MRKLLPVLVLFLSAYSLNSQTNPLYVEYFINPNPLHWMFSEFSDSVSGYWARIDSLPQALYGVNAYYWSQNNKVFVCGGSSQENVPSAQCWWYNIANNTYEPAAPLPHGRWSGKLLRVKDSLYLIGSVDSTFTSADGFVFMYSLNQNTWVLKDTMPQPHVHECAAAVINDSLIITIGGSTNAFVSPRNFVKVYNPRTGNWTTSVTPFPVNNTTSHADCLKLDTAYNLFVLGGFGNGVLNSVYRGVLTLRTGDSAVISWSEFDTLNANLFGQGVYRVAGARWNNTLLFGPAVSSSSVVNQVWGLTIIDTADYVWTRFLPNTSDTAGNISTYGVKSGTDSNYFFLFGGFKNPAVLSTSQKYAFATPPPFGIINTHSGVPSSYRLFQNYPNPFNPSTHIEFAVPKAGFVSLIIYDILGRQVELLASENLKAGKYKAVWDASKRPSGIYFYSLITANFRETKKMILVK